MIKIKHPHLGGVFPTNNATKMVKMNMDLIAGNKDDEYYTPNYAIIPILKYLKKVKSSGVLLIQQIAIMLKHLKKRGL